jgi:multimeric flavodoxin WrbA
VENAEDLRYNERGEGIRVKNILVIYGSPRKNSGSAALARALLEQKPADASVKEYDAYRLNAKPCLGCGGCDRKVGCVQRDLDEFYKDFEAADYVVFASPVYNGGFPAPLKAILDRFQCYYALRFAHGVKPPIAKHRRAALVMTGGCEAQGSEHMTETLRQQFTVLNAELAATVTVTGTDRRALSEEDFAEAREAGAALFETEGGKHNA